MPAGSAGGGGFGRLGTGVARDATCGGVPGLPVDGVTLRNPEVGGGALASGADVVVSGVGTRGWRAAGSGSPQVGAFSGTGGSAVAGATICKGTSGSGPRTAPSVDATISPNTRTRRSSSSPRVALLRSLIPAPLALSAARPSGLDLRVLTVELFFRFLRRETPRRVLVLRIRAAFRARLHDRLVQSLERAGFLEAPVASLLHVCSPLPGVPNRG